MADPNTAAGEDVRDLWQELLEADDRTSPENHPDMCLITLDELSEFIARARPETALAHSNPWVARVYEVRAEAEEEGVGAWVACTGCQESVDGHVSSRDYPYSAVFGCQPGGGCSECGGLGVKWDNTDWDEAARFMLDDTAEQDREERLANALEPFALLAPDSGTEGVNMGDPLSKWLTIAQLVEAKSALDISVEARR